MGATLFRPTLAAPASSTSPAADGPSDESASPPLTAPAPRVRTGLDVLAAQDFALLRGHTIGIITNQTGIDAQGRRGIDLLAASKNVTLQAIFSPEHGITGTVDADVPHGRDLATGRPIWSLYGPTRRPSEEMLRGLSAIVFDVQDVGARYYTYLATLQYTMEEAAKLGIAVIVLDRPNPITGRVVEGPLLDPDLTSFTGPHAIPVRTGITIGEFARLAAAERKIPVKLTVVPLDGWERGRWFDETGLPWVNPSPNIRSVTQALLYSGIGLLEATNLSVGRGTDTPFEHIGAPWIDGARLAETLNARGLAGVRFYPVSFTPASSKFAGELCGGVFIVITDRQAVRPVRVGVEIAAALLKLFPGRLQINDAARLFGSTDGLRRLAAGEDPAAIAASWGAAESRWRLLRAKYLLY